MAERVVLAYSGGLDTSVALRWLAEEYNADVVALLIDVGQGIDAEAVTARALAAGAADVEIVDVRDEFAAGYVLPVLQAGGREMLVPLVLVTVQFRDAAGVEHRISQGFVIGVERVDSPKLAPFWLDSSRMIEQVAARPSGAPRRWRLG